MIKGYNSDISFNGYSYHVQTEDWGLDNPYFVSSIFKNGEVLKSLKLSYKEVFPRGLDSSQDTLKIALSEQHKQVIRLLLSGKIID